MIDEPIWSYPYAVHVYIGTTIGTQYHVPEEFIPVAKVDLGTGRGGGAMSHATVVV